jgi:hypothetical protein
MALIFVLVVVAASELRPFFPLYNYITMYWKVSLGVRDQAGSKNKCRKCSPIIQFIFNLQRKISSQVFKGTGT